MADARLVSPVLYEVRANVLLESVAADAAAAAAAGDAANSPAAAPAPVTLADVPPAYFVDLRRAGVDVLYLLGVWTVGAAGVAHSVDKLGPERAGLAVSSPFAVCDYHVDPAFGGDDALRALKAAANAAGLRVIIDFVPNHLARDHRWTLTKPWLFVQGTDADAARHRDRYFQVTLPAAAATAPAAPAAGASGDSSGAATAQQPALESTAAPPQQQLWLAHGRDPYSGGWRDTVQLNYRHPQLRGIMKAVLVWIARSGLADGVRCDMAMLVLNDVVQKTWGDPPAVLPGPYPVPPPEVDLPDICPPPVAATAASAAAEAAAGAEPSTQLQQQQQQPAAAAAPPAAGDAAAAAPSLLCSASDDTVTSDASATSSAVAAGDTGGTAAAAAAPCGGLTIDMRGINNAKSPEPGESVVIQKLGSDHALRPVADDEWWPDAIAAVKAVRPDFLFLAEVYWDLEFRLLSAGFDFCYDKTLYDRLLMGTAEHTLGHLRAPLGWQQRLARFTENHDEQRALAVHRGGERGALAAAVVTYLAPGLRFFHDGQFEGRRQHHSMHVGPRPPEPANLEVLTFYRRLLGVLATPEVKYGRWHLGAVTPSRDGNDSWRSLIVFWITPSPGLGGLLQGALLPPMPRIIAPPSLSPTIAALTSSTAATAATSGGGGSGDPSQPATAQQAAAAAAAGGGISDFHALPPGQARPSSSGAQPPLAADGPATTTPSAPPPSSSSDGGSGGGSSQLTGRTFLVLVNYSDRPSNGHVLFSRADDSAYSNPDGAAGAAHVASLCRGYLQPRGATGTRIAAVAGGLTPAAAAAPLRPVPTTAAAAGGVAATAAVPAATTVAAVASTPLPPANTGRGVPSAPPPPQPAPPAAAATDAVTAAASAGAPLLVPLVRPPGAPRPVRRIGLIDQLSSYVKEYPAAHVAGEGWWVAVEPWRAAVLEVVQLGDE